MMSYPTPPKFPSADPAPSFSLLEDLPCRSCGYNLRTLSTDTICPECGTPVVSSLRGELLRDADPAWLHWMNIGCTCLYWGVWCTFIAYIFFQSFRRTWPRSTLVSAAAVFIAAGTWMLGSPDPSGIGENRYGHLRSWARGTSLLMLAVTILRCFPPSLPSSGVYLLEPALRIATLVWGVCLLMYVNGLYRRTKGRSRGFRVRAWLFASLGTASIVAWVIFNNRGPFRRTAPFVLVQILATGFPLTIPILYGAIYQFRKSLKAEIAAAPNLPNRSTWRFAGSLIYSVRDFARSKNADEK
jgi:hypothetical protein